MSLVLGWSTHPLNFPFLLIITSSAFPRFLQSEMERCFFFSYAVEFNFLQSSIHLLYQTSKNMYLFQKYFHQLTSFFHYFVFSSLRCSFSYWCFDCLHSSCVCVFVCVVHISFWLLLPSLVFICLVKHGESIFAGYELNYSHDDDDD